MRRLLVLGAALFVVLAASFSVAAKSPNGNGFPPITASGQAVQGDTGSCNNDWATVALEKAYKLTRTGVGAYNLEVKERGPLTTIAGQSPGACVSGTDNGNTVGAGVTGMTHQTFNAPVTSSAVPDTTPDCAANNGCTSSTDFLNAVFGVSAWSRGGFSWTAHYEAGSNGTYFDTSVNWPLNNRGDITGS